MYISLGNWLADWLKVEWLWDDDKEPERVNDRYDRYDDMTSVEPMTVQTGSWSRNSRKFHEYPKHILYAHHCHKIEVLLYISNHTTNTVVLLYTRYPSS